MIREWLELEETRQERLAMTQKIVLVTFLPWGSNRARGAVVLLFLLGIAIGLSLWWYLQVFNAITVQKRGQYIAKCKTKRNVEGTRWSRPSGTHR